ncbi:MAG: hypothetical protein NT007_00420 [Candidatus Kapabacteria bacterium]|nr:hypothetical protein [Candidatus Kapabacteria bacterium]
MLKIAELIYDRIGNDRKKKAEFLRELGYTNPTHGNLAFEHIIHGRYNDHIEDKLRNVLKVKKGELEKALDEARIYFHKIYQGDINLFFVYNRKLFPVERSKIEKAPPRVLPEISFEYKGATLKGKFTYLESGDFCIRLIEPNTGGSGSCGCSNHIMALARVARRYAEGDGRLTEYGLLRAKEKLIELYESYLFQRKNEKQINQVAKSGQLKYKQTYTEQKELQKIFWAQRAELKKRLKSGELNPNEYAKLLKPISRAFDDAYYSLSDKRRKIVQRATESEIFKSINSCSASGIISRKLNENYENETKSNNKGK